jgi:hypothetical protein
MEINLFDSAINFHCIVDSPYRDPSGIISTEIESTLLKSGKAWILNLTYYETGVVDPWIAINERFDGKHHNIGINARNNQQTVFQKNERQSVYEAVYEVAENPHNVVLDYFNDPVDQHPFMNYFDFDVGNVKQFNRNVLQDKFIAIAEMAALEIYKSDRKSRITIVIDGIWNLGFEHKRFLENFYREMRKFNCSIITIAPPAYLVDSENNISFNCAKENSAYSIKLE